MADATNQPRDPGSAQFLMDRQGHAVYDNQNQRAVRALQWGRARAVS